MIVRQIVLSCLAGLLGTAWGSPDVVSATPISLVPNTLNMFRDTRGLNDVGIGQGDLFQFGADIQGGAAGSTLGAVYPPTNFQVSPGLCAPLAVNLNFCARSPAFSSARIDARWSFTFRNGPDTLTVDGPTLTDNNRAIATTMPFPGSVTLTAGSSPETPTISWGLPVGFVPDGFRVNIFDKGVRRENGQADVIHSVAIPAGSRSYTIPSVLSSGQTLSATGAYSINLQLIETRGHVPFTSNNNALILRRSSSFFSFTPTRPGAPDVHLPQVGPDPNPNDNLGAPYVFRIERVGPNKVTFIDPVVAVGYDYAIGPGDPNFASVVLPNVGDGSYEVSFNGIHEIVLAGEQLFFPEGGVAAFSVRAIETSARLDPGNVNAFITGLTFVREGDFTGTMTPIVQEIPDGPLVTSLGPAKVWIGLRNSDDVGLRVDLRAEAFVNDESSPAVATGQLNNVSTGSSGFERAVLHAIPLALGAGQVALEPGDQLLLRVSVRRTCFGGGHASGSVRLWYNGRAVDAGRTRDAATRVEATVDVDGVDAPYYLRTGLKLDETPGAARTFIEKAINSAARCHDRPFVPVETWSTQFLNP